VKINYILNNVQINLKFRMENGHFNATFFVSPNCLFPSDYCPICIIHFSYRIHLKTGVHLSRMTGSISFHMQQYSKKSVGTLRKPLVMREFRGCVHRRYVLCMCRSTYKANRLFTIWEIGVKSTQKDWRRCLNLPHIQSARGPFLQECEREITWNSPNCHEYRDSTFLKTMGYTHQITCCLCRSQVTAHLFFRVVSTPQLFCSP